MRPRYAFETKKPTKSKGLRWYGKILALLQNGTLGMLSVEC